MELKKARDFGEAMSTDYKKYVFHNPLDTHLKQLNVFWVIKNSLKWNLRMMRQRYLNVKEELLNGCSKPAPRHIWQMQMCSGNYSPRIS